MSLYKVSYSCVNIKGNARETNQDNFYACGEYRKGSDGSADIITSGEFDSDSGCIVAVYDGMGGEQRGEMASLIAARCTEEADKKVSSGAKILSELFSKADKYISEFAGQNNISCMGTTAAALRFDGTSIVAANVGDSAIYRLTNGRLYKMSREHTVFSAALGHSALTQFLGISASDELVPDPFFDECGYVDGSRFLICSDGVTRVLPDGTIRSVISCGTVHDAALRLVSESLKNGSRDNITVLLCEIKKGEN